MIGPLAPTVRELRSLGAGAPVLMVEPVFGFWSESLMEHPPGQASGKAFSVWLPIINVDHCHPERQGWTQLVANRVEHALRARHAHGGDPAPAAGPPALCRSG